MVNKVKVQYNQETGFVIGNFPDWNNYSLDINIEAKTIDGFPYKEVTKEQWESNLGKVMQVVNGVYQEYIKPDSVKLQESKEAKIKELESYHFTSNEVRILMINGTYPISMSKDGRDLVDEQILFLERRIAEGEITDAEADFNYISSYGSSSISLENLRKLSIKILSVTNANFATYQAHLAAIKLLTSLDAVNDYDFTENYLKNQTFNIELRRLIK